MLQTRTGISTRVKFCMMLCLEDAAVVRADGAARLRGRAARRDVKLSAFSPKTKQSREEAKTQVVFQSEHSGFRILWSKNMKPVHLLGLAILFSSGGTCFADEDAKAQLAAKAGSILERNCLQCHRGDGSAS